MNDLQAELTKQIKRLNQEFVSDFIEEDDKEGIFRQEIFSKYAELGLAGVITSDQFSGSGLGYEDLCLALEEIAKTSVPYAVTISVSSMVQSILSNYGTLKQKEKYLPKLATGEEIGSFALSESHSGSDAASLKATAKKVDGGFILNGSKMWVTSGGIAKTYIVMARTGNEGAKGISAFIVRDGAEGFSYGKKEQKMGWKTSPTRELIFENCFIPQENLLGKENEGFKIALNSLSAGRITIGSISVGVAQAALNTATSYSLSREQFSKAIFNFQGIQFMLADMDTEIQASRLLVNQAAILLDQGKTCPKLSAMAKMKASDTAMKVTTDAVQILGGAGYTTEYPVCLLYTSPSPRDRG